MRLGPDTPTVVEPGIVERKVAAAVSGADLELLESIEDAGEDQMSERDRSLGRVADQVREIEGNQPLTERTSHRMDKHDGAQLFSPGPELEMALVGQFAAIHRS